MEECIKSDEIEIFESENFQNLIMFKWEKFARKDHYLGFIFHIIYTTSTILYINDIYILNHKEDTAIYDTLITVSIIYPAIYESI